MNVLYILAAILLLGLIVALHEFGHYLAARLTGIGVSEYSIGMGPRLWGFEKSGIKYSLRAIPLGGYCAFIGEDEMIDNPRAMRNQPVWKRFITTVSGPLMNIVLAFVVMVAFYGAYGAYEAAPLVASLVEGSVAEEAGFEAGDIITCVNGVEISADAEGQSLLIDTIRDADDSTQLQFEVERNGQDVQISLTPEWNEEAQAYQIGVLLGTAHAELGFFESVRFSWIVLVQMFGMMLDGLKQLFVQKDALQQMMGPVGIVSTLSRDFAYGMEMVLNWIVVISLNLGIINLLPFPGLDGGRLLFLIVEGIRRKPISVEKEAWAHAGGLLLFVGMIIVITFFDVAKLFG